MKTWNWIKVSGVVAAGLLVATQAHAVIAYNYSSALPGLQPDGPFSLGTVFSVTGSPINVNQLGVFDQGANGVGGAGIDVAIYSITLSGTAISGGTLAVPSFHFSGTSESLLAGTSTRVASVSPVTLGVGTYMVVANHYGTGGAEVDYNPYWANLGNASGPNAASANPAFGVTFLGAGGYYNGNSGLSWGAALPGGWNYDPSSFTPAAPRYAAGNFDFAPVPEAATFGAAAVSLLGLVYVGRYVRIRRSQAA